MLQQSDTSTVTLIPDKLAIIQQTNGCVSIVRQLDSPTLLHKTEEK